MWFNTSEFDYRHQQLYILFIYSAISPSHKYYLDLRMNILNCYWRQSNDGFNWSLASNDHTLMLISFRLFNIRNKKFGIMSIFSHKPMLDAKLKKNHHLVMLYIIVSLYTSYRAAAYRKILALAHKPPLRISLGPKFDTHSPLERKNCTLFSCTLLYTLH